MRKLLFTATFLSALPFAAFSQTFPTVDDSPAGAHFDASANVDILGLRAGDTQEDVKAKLAELFPDEGDANETRLKGNVASPTGTQVQLDFVSALGRGSDHNEIPLYRTGKSGDFPKVFFASEAYGNRAIGMRREIYFGPDEIMSADAMRLTIEEKYGKPTAITKDHAGHVQRVAYFYTSGKPMAETRYRLGYSCSGDCEAASVTHERSGNTSTRRIVAKEPCGGMAEWIQSSSDVLTYKFNDETVVEDDKCDGVLLVSFTGPSAKLESTRFTLIDTKRAYGHRKALDAAIKKSLEEQSPAAPTANKPRL